MSAQEFPAPTLTQVREDIERGQMIVLLPRDMRLLLAEIDRLTAELSFPQSQGQIP